MCFVLWWYRGLLEIYIVVLIFTKQMYWLLYITPKSLNKPKIQIISQVVDAIALYPASVNDLKLYFVSLSSKITKKFLFV